jgi:hypothetical protein
MRRTFSSFALLLLLPLNILAAENSVAVVTSTGSASIQTATEIRRDLLGECILKLPTESQLAVVTTSSDQFLRKIDGSDKDGFTTVWSSHITIGWQVRQRYLYVVSTKGVGTTAAPVFRNDTAQVFQSEQVFSDPGESSHFHGNESRTRYFATAQEAEASARKRASARLRELQANACSDSPAR